MGFVVRAAWFLAVVAVVACRSAQPPTPAPTPAPHPGSPGPLAAVHASVDDPSGCVSCHVDDTARLDVNKCMACHRDLAERIAAGKGLHASAVVRGKPCEACHGDHRGRAFDLMGWRSLRGGRDGFDHDLTGWPLDGAHQSQSCSSCHSKKDKQGLAVFMGTERQCGSCHSNQPHLFTARAFLACDRCHSTRSWQPARSEMRFNHDDRRDARMPLLGVHAAVACARCHARAVFALGLAEPGRCDNCHQNPHAGQLFGMRDCAWCHSPTFKQFTTTMFDHTEHTRFDLGGHKVLACSRCHTSALGTTAPAMACESCHANRQPHGNRFDAFGRPPACGLCHTNEVGTTPQTKWRLRGFDHAKNTKWPLTFQHADLACRACHRGAGPTSFEKLGPGNDCMGCHAHATVHDKKYTNAQCLTCHTAPGTSTIRTPP